MKVRWNETRSESLILWRRRGDLDVIDSGEFAAIGCAFDADVVTRAQREVTDLSTRRSVASQLSTGKIIIGDPLIDDAITHKHAELCLPIALVKILHAEVVLSHRSIEMEGG